MAWFCPACRTPIRHSEFEQPPRVDGSYRCLVCRLDLVLNRETDTLVIAPTRADEPNQKIRHTS